MYLVIRLLGALALIAALAASQSHKDDGTCYSRFDYESKMLERIVLVEHRMNVLTESTKHDLDQFGLTIRRMKKDQAEHHREMIKRFDALRISLENAQDAKLAELTETGNELKNTSGRLVAEHRTNVEELGEKFENKSRQLQGEIDKNKEGIVSDVTAFTDDLDVKYKAQLDALTAVEYDMKEMAENMQEEQSLKLQAMEAVAMEIKVDMQERVLKLEETDRCQQLEFDKAQREFEESVNNTFNEIKVSGLGIKPAVSFNVRDVTNTSPNTGDTLLFSYVLSNTDNVYNISNGMFTAPVPGTYWFSVQLCGHSHGQTSFRIEHNNKGLSDATTLRQDTVCTSSNAVVELAKGDTVCVKTQYTYFPNSNYRRYGYALITSATNYRSAFMGALVH